VTPHKTLTPPQTYIPTYSHHYNLQTHILASCIAAHSHNHILMTHKSTYLHSILSFFKFLGGLDDPTFPPPNIILFPAPSCHVIIVTLASTCHVVVCLYSIWDPDMGKEQIHQVFSRVSFMTRDHVFSRVSLMTRDHDCYVGEPINKLVL